MSDIDSILSSFNNTQHRTILRKMYELIKSEIADVQDDLDSVSAAVINDLDAIETDLGAIKAAFDGHDHDGTADQTPIDTEGDDLTFTVTHSTTVT